jgi:hypothetical protein
MKKRLRPNEREGYFKKGDRVIHLDYGPGTVLKNISNEYAEVYEVKYDKNGGLHSSAGLLTFE